MVFATQFFTIVQNALFGASLIVFMLLAIRYILWWRTLEPNMATWLEARPFGRIAWILVSVGHVMKAVPVVLSAEGGHALSADATWLLVFTGSLMIATGGSYALTALAIADGNKPSILWVHLLIPVLITAVIVGGHYARFT